jgi:hypothetical protein
LSGFDDERKVVQQVICHFGAPAFLRRAHAAQMSFDSLIDSCRQRREEMIAMVTLYVGTLYALSSNWTALRPLLADDESLEALRQLHDELQPRLRITVTATTSIRKLRRALVELREAIDHFNRRWLEFLERVDLQGVNRLREGYNRYYLLEKECALGSPRLARLGFRELEPITKEGLVSRLTPLISIKLA